MTSISELVWLYVKRRPLLKESLREGIVNYSALARRISIEIFGRLKKENAVKMALVRMASRITESEEDLEKRILEVLKGSTLSIRNKIAVVISSRELADAEYISFVEGKGFFTYMMEEETAQRIKKAKSTLSIEPNLNLIVIHSPPALEKTPGVIAYMLNALAEEGINVIEFVSCYTDTMLVVKQADTTRAYEIISLLTQ